MTDSRIAFLGARQDAAQSALRHLIHQYGNYPPEAADVIVVLGGDGFMLHSLHRCLDMGKPIYGMNRGTVGFLMNDFHLDGLRDRLSRAQPHYIHPLVMDVVTLDGATETAIAINEVSVLRLTHLAAKIRIKVDGVERLDELVCDGALLSTPAGSTAYNNAAGGPILPLGAEVLALTPISAFRPRRWRGALLPRSAVVTFDILHADERRVGAMADSRQVLDVRRVTVREDRSHVLSVLFDPEQNLDERVLKEQFVP